MQQFKITDYPNGGNTQYSENLMVTIGRKGLHIYDVDKEKWIMNSEEEGHQYESLHNALENGDVFSSDEQDENIESEEEEMPELVE